MKDEVAKKAQSNSKVEELRDLELSVSHILVLHETKKNELSILPSQTMKQVVKYFPSNSVKQCIEAQNFTNAGYTKYPEPASCVEAEYGFSGK